MRPPIKATAVLQFLAVLLNAGPSATAAMAAPSATSAEAPGASVPGTTDAALQKIIADYVGLYRADSIDRWKELFHPGLTVADPRPDGTIRIRGLEEFFAYQKAGFVAGRITGERLENVRVETGRRIARVNADYIFSGEGKESRGRLGLHLVQSDAGWKVVAIVFAYD